MIAFGSVVAAFCVIGIVSFAVGEPWGPILPWASRHCKDSGLGCNVVTQFLFTWAALVIAFLTFVGLRYTRLRRAYLRYAREHPTDLVETAGSILGDIVGRDELCEILEEDLKDPHSRRPHVLIGGLGIGKTAVLVRLSKVLAQRGAVPVPIRLRDARGKIDFLELARQRFVDQLGHKLRTTAEGDRVWRELRKQDLVVVLADGLEEAFADEATSHDRDHRVRVAILQAADQRFPLIIASRPHEALRAIEAARVHLEPLSEEVALDYIKSAERRGDERILHWVVETAEVTETPLYLQLAHDLHAGDLLEGIYESTPSSDRVPVRLRLIRDWLDALVKGTLHDTENVPLPEMQRMVTIWHLEALACVALRDDTQQLLFDDYVSEASALKPLQPSAPGTGAGELPKSAQAIEAERVAARAAVIGVLERHLTERLAGLKDDTGRAVPEVYDIQANAGRAIQLQLLDHVPKGVRFPHSIVQAYLGARVIGEVLDDDDPHSYLEHGLTNPGRELLMSLVMYARSTELGRGAAAKRDRLRPMLLQRLVDAAENLGQSGKTLDTLAAAVEVGFAIEHARGDRSARWTAAATFSALRRRWCRQPGGEAAIAARTMVERWDTVKATDDATRDSKLNAVARLGDAARLLSEDPAAEGPEVEPGDGEARRPRRRRNKARAKNPGATPPISVGLYRSLYLIARKEDLYPVRLAAAQRIGFGGDAAWDELERAFDPRHKEPDTTGRTPSWESVLATADPKVEGGELPAVPAATVEAEAESWWEPSGERRFAIQSWLLPMLAASIKDEKRSRRAFNQLDLWIEHVAGEGEDGPMPLALEAALAQGFKHAANRRPHHSHDQAEARAHLQQLAARMIHRTRFWYSRIALLHALCLLELAREEFPGHPGHQAEREKDPETLVGRWLRRSTDSPEPEHRFVCEAADLVAAALERRHPERFIWIDESGVVAKIGSRSETGERHNLRSLWIPPSAGWVPLHPRAQQLVADIQILLNLAERGEAARKRELRLGLANQDELPPCLTGDRCEHLKPSQTVGMADVPEPGDECKRGCRVKLCPYPPRGQQPYRVELSEAFCRHQAATVRAGDQAPWQDASVTELRCFWDQMEERARK